MALGQVTFVYPVEGGTYVRRTEVTVRLSTGRQPVTVESIGLRYAPRRHRHTTIGTFRRHDDPVPEGWPAALGPEMSHEGCRVDAGAVRTVRLGQVQVPAELIAADGTVEVRAEVLLARTMTTRTRIRWVLKLVKRLSRRRSLPERVEAVAASVGPVVQPRAVAAAPGG